MSRREPSDPFAEIGAAAHAHHAWVHVDGAFGLWASAVPSLADQVRGLAGADSWTTDAHKWLNVPYDSGIAICAHPAPHRAAMSLHASYLIRGEDEQRVGMDWVPESSRRARVIPLYALIRTLGRTGIQAMIAKTCTLAKRMAERLAQAPNVRILNDVVLNQVLARFGDGVDATADDRYTREIIARVQADGTCWAGGAVWQGTTGDANLNLQLVDDRSGCRPVGGGDSALLLQPRAKAGPPVRVRASLGAPSAALSSGPSGPASAALAGTRASRC